jgi:GT2 family glycosyltransferase
MSGETLLQLQPLSALDRHDGESWVAREGPIRFKLDPGAQGFPEGWVLLTAKLSPTILDGAASLTLVTAAGETSHEVPVSSSGSVFELVRFPPAVRRVLWQPSLSPGGFQHTPLVARRIGPAERLWLMIRRVAYMNLKQPAVRKQKVGLAWQKALFDLPGQYAACGRLRAYPYHLIPYGLWIERFDRLTDFDRWRIRRRIGRMGGAPRFALVVCGEGEGRAATLRSIEGQIYRNFALADAAAPFQPTDYVAVLQAGDQLAEHALYWAAEAIVAGGDVAMVYADEDTIDAAGSRADPRFKPDWSPEHLRSINYVGRWAPVRGAELAAAGGLAAQDLTGDGHQLNLRVAAVLKSARVVHVPALLVHRSAANPISRPVPRTRHALPASPPLVSIVIPTRDAEMLLRNCIESIERASTYARYEILVVDNRSRDEAALRYLQGLKHRVLRYDAPFNYSAINNLAVREARGEVVLLLNNDTAVISPDWLEEMLGHLHQEGVGVVGAKLLYAYDRVQHAGVAVGPGGCADHVHVGIARDAPGYCYRAVVAQELSAVTGACLMTWKSLYQRLGGLDEADFPIAFNDVDYCLRVQQAGYRVVFTPHALLYHDESASRGRNVTAEQQVRAAREADVARRKWGPRMRDDPYYNPNLSYERPDFSLSDAPRVRKPWVSW